MKKFFVLLLLPVLTTSFTITNTAPLTAEERKYAIDLLKQTQKDLLASVQGLSEAQLNFKPAPDRWSVLECVQHITLSSAGLRELADGTLKVANDSALKSQVTDDMFVKMVEDRSHQYQVDYVPVDLSQPVEQVLYSFLLKRNKLL